MCPLSPQDQHVCQSYHRIAEAVTCLLGGAQFSSYPLYHPRSSCNSFRPTRKAAIGAGNFPDSNGISDDFKRQNRSHETEPVPMSPFSRKRLYGGERPCCCFSNFASRRLTLGCRPCRVLQYTALSQILLRRS